MYYLYTSLGAPAQSAKILARCLSFESRIEKFDFLFESPLSL